MARPTPSDISAALTNWDAEVQTNFDLLFETPVPLANYGTVGALPAASSYADCVALVTGDGVYYSDGSSWTKLSTGNPIESLVIALGDESTAITAGTSKVTFRIPYAFTLTDVRASVNSACSTGTLTIDINESGTTVLSTKITIDATEKTSTTAATPVVISDTSLADDAEITLDVDNAGDGTATGLKVVLIGRRT